MITGQRAFNGEDAGDTLAAVLRAEPDWTLLPKETDFPVRTLLHACLERDLRLMKSGEPGDGYREIR
jgi:hypothetical protein